MPGSVIAVSDIHDSGNPSHVRVMYVTLGCYILLIYKMFVLAKRVMACRQVTAYTARAKP